MNLDEPFTGVVCDADGVEVPVLVEHDGHTVSWLAHDVPSLGWRAYRFAEGVGDTGGWELSLIHI